MIYLPIYKTLNANADVKTIFGDNLRIYEDIAPIGTATPYAVWQEVGGNAENNLDCPANTDHITIQIDIYTLEPQHLRTIREAARKALELDNSCTVTSLRGNEREPITKLYRTGFDSNWFVDR